MKTVNDELPAAAPVMKIPATPQDVNMYGAIFGGWLMSQVDLAGAARAIECTRGRVATRAVADFQFLRPVNVGDLVMLYADVARVGTTSITIDVHVYIERHAPPFRDVVVQKVAEARLVYVALNAAGVPRKISPASGHASR